MYKFHLLVVRQADLGERDINPGGDSIRDPGGGIAALAEGIHTSRLGITDQVPDLAGLSISTIKDLTVIGQHHVLDGFPIVRAVEGYIRGLGEPEEDLGYFSSPEASQIDALAVGTVSNADDLFLLGEVFKRESVGMAVHIHTTSE